MRKVLNLPCIYSCKWGPAQFPQGWSRRQVSCSSSWRRQPRWAAHALLVRFCDTDFQKCPPARLWTATAPQLSFHSELFHNAGWKEHLRNFKASMLGRKCGHSLWKKQQQKIGVVTIPAFVVHIEDSSGEGGLSWPFRNSGVIQITQFGVSLTLWIPHILTQHHIWHGHWSDALQHLHLRQGTQEILYFHTRKHKNKSDKCLVVLK